MFRAQRYRGPRARLAHSFATRWADDLRRADGSSGVATIGIETETGTWYEVPLDLDQLLELLDELRNLAARYPGRTRIS